MMQEIAARTCARLFEKHEKLELQALLTNVTAGMAQGESNHSVSLN